MLLICAIEMVINAGGLPWITKINVEGNLIRESETKYLVDFTEGVKKLNLADKNPSDYEKVLVDKSQCVKE